MIPRNIILLAIEGGWRLAPYYKGKTLTQEDIKRIADYFVDRNNTGALKSWQETALDPLFWQALGRALGWHHDYHVVYGQKVYEGHIGEWKSKAHEFYDLILTNGDITKFWQEITK